MAKFMSKSSINFSDHSLIIICNFIFQGNLTNLIEMTHWQGNDVLYIGDHIYGDLAVSHGRFIDVLQLIVIRIYFSNMDGEPVRF